MDEMATDEDVEEIHQFAKEVKRKAASDAEFCLKDLVQRLRNRRRHKLLEASKDSKYALSTEPKPQTYIFGTSEAHCHAPFQAPASIAARAFDHKDMRQRKLRARTHEEKLTEEDVETKPWLYTAAPKALTTGTRLDRVERVANVQARARILRVLGPEFGRTPDTVGASHIPRGLRIARMSKYGVSEQVGPTSYTVSKVCEEAVSQRCVFNYKANLLFGPPKARPSRSPSKRSPVVDAPSPAPVPIRRKKKKVVVVEKPTLQLPQEVLLEDLAAYFCAMLDVEEQTEAGSVYSPEPTHIVESDAGEMSVKEEPSEMSLYRESTQVPQESSEVKEDTVDSETEREVPSATEIAKYLKLLGKEKFRRRTLRVPELYVMKRSIRNISFDKTTGRVRHRAHRATSCPHRNEVSRHHRVCRTTDAIEEIADAIIEEAAANVVSETPVSSTPVVRRPSYYAGRQVVSWSREAAAEKIARAIQSRWKRTRRVDWYASQLHTVYQNAQQPAEEVELGSIRRRRVLSAPPTVRVPSVAIPMQKQLGREDESKEADVSVLVYDAAASKDYLLRRPVSSYDMSRGTGRDSGKEAEEEDQPQLYLQPNYQYGQTGLPALSFARAERFEEKEDEDFDGPVLDIRPEVYDLQLRDGRYGRTSVAYSKSVGRDDGKEDEGDTYVLDLRPNFNAVMPRANRGMHIEYDKDATERGADDSRIDEPVLILSPNYSVDRPSTVVHKFSTAEKMVEEKRDDEDVMHHLLALEGASNPSKLAQAWLRK